MNKSSKMFAFVAIGIVAGIAGAMLAREWRSKSESTIPTLNAGTYIQPARVPPPFMLIDQNGAPFTAERLNGRWTLMFFGFANCGDVCPTTLTTLGQVAKSFAGEPLARQPQLVFVSVDSRRDTPEVLKEYVRHFDPNMIGVTGKQSDLDAFTAALGVPSAIRPLEVGYAVDHSASIIAFNTEGAFQALFSAPHSTEALIADFKALTARQ